MTIGNDPLVDTLVLVPGQDFLHEIMAPIGDTIAAGTEVDLVFYRPDGSEIATWEAEVSSTSATWNVESEVADTISFPASFRIYCRYSDGTDLCWFRGAVTRQE